MDTGMASSSIHQSSCQLELFLGINMSIDRQPVNLYLHLVSAGLNCVKHASNRLLGECS